MRFYEIVEGDTTGIIEPVASDEPAKAERYQSRQPRPKKRPRWQMPPVAPKLPVPSAEPARPHPTPTRP